MPWIPEEHMAEVHIIRQDYARALAARDADWSPKNEAALFEVEERRARAMRSLYRDDNATVRHIAAMFRCSKATVRASIQDVEVDDE